MQFPCSITVLQALLLSVFYSGTLNFFSSGITLFNNQLTNRYTLVPGKQPNSDHLFQIYVRTLYRLPVGNKRRKFIFNQHPCRYFIVDISLFLRVLFLNMTHYKSYRMLFLTNVFLTLTLDGIQMFCFGFSCHKNAALIDSYQLV